MRASASSREKAASSISSKKLYQGLPSLVPDPLDAHPAHDGHEVLRERLHEDAAQALVDALGVLVEHVDLVDEAGPASPLRVRAASSSTTAAGRG
jgi:hypothetical protein